MEGNPQACGRIICTSTGVGADKQMMNYQIERVVGTGSFGVVFQAKCLETGEIVSPLTQVICHKQVAGCRWHIPMGNFSQIVNCRYLRVDARRCQSCKNCHKTP